MSTRWVTELPVGLGRSLELFQDGRRVAHLMCVDRATRSIAALLYLRRGLMTKSEFARLLRKSSEIEPTDKEAALAALSYTRPARQNGVWMLELDCPQATDWATCMSIIKHIYNGLTKFGVSLPHLVFEEGETCLQRRWKPAKGGNPERAEMRQRYVRALRGIPNALS